MGHVGPLLLLALAAAAMGASAQTLPPLPQAADMPPCLNDLWPCVDAYQNNSSLAPCCGAIEKVYKSNKTCICSIINEADQNAKQLGLNYPTNGEETFGRCKNLSGYGCDDHGTAGSQIKNAASDARAIGGAYMILLLLPLFFKLLA